MNDNFARVREQLQRRRRELLSRTERVDHDLSRVEGPLSPDFSEQAVQVQNDETLVEIARAAAEEVEAIDEALTRIAEGEYGICKRCGEPIDSRRLAAVPHSVTCAGCSS